MSGGDFYVGKDVNETNYFFPQHEFHRYKEDKYCTSILLTTISITFTSSPKFSYSMQYFRRNFRSIPSTWVFLYTTALFLTKNSLNK